MSDLFYLLMNEDNQVLARNGDWLGLRDEKSFYRSIHKDEVINARVELTVKNPLLRIQLIEAQLVDGKFDFPQHLEIVEDVERPVEIEESEELEQMSLHESATDSSADTRTLSA